MKGIEKDSADFLFIESFARSERTGIVAGAEGIRFLLDGADFDTAIYPPEHEAAKPPRRRMRRKGDS